MMPHHPPFFLVANQLETSEDKEWGCATLKRATTEVTLSSAGEEQAKITWGWEVGAGHPFLFGWIHSGFQFLPIYWDNSWLLVHMALEVASQKSGGSRICFPTHLHTKSPGSHFELMWMVEVVEAPQHQACQEAEVAWVHSGDYLLQSWMATGGWQAGPG